MRRFTTELVGYGDMDGFSFCFRVVREDDLFFLMCGSGLSDESYPSMQAAKIVCELAWQTSGGKLTWRTTPAPNDGETPCFMCGALADLRRDARYPALLCDACVREAVDENGRSLEFWNVDGSGGFEARYSDTDEVRDSHVCFVRGMKCWADERYFGGIVVVPARG